MSRHRWSLRLRLLVGMVVIGLATTAGKKKKIEEWPLNVHFVIGNAACQKDRCSADCKKILDWLRDEIATAEDMYASKPALKINPDFYFVKERGGKNLSHPTFKNHTDFHKWMDKRFDHVAKSKTTGWMRVLVSDAVTVKGEKLTGIANYAHTTRLFSLKHAPIITPPSRSCNTRLKMVLAHELGHIFGMLHTHERYHNGSRCNKDYDKNDPGGSLEDGKINLMDSDGFEDSNGCPRPVYLNSCQREMAADKRRHWMTRKGKVKYRKVSGWNKDKEPADYEKAQTGEVNCR